MKRDREISKRQVKIGHFGDDFDEKSKIVVISLSLIKTGKFLNIFEIIYDYFVKDPTICWGSRW